MEHKIEHQVFDEERALYHLQDTEVSDCVFAGTADGESVLKEIQNVTVKRCSFSLRYPLWHADGYELSHSILDDKTRAPIWYARNGKMQDCIIDGIKCLRECSDIEINGCTIQSPEFGWRCKNLKMADSTIQSEYFLFQCENVEISHLQMQGKYSFQYMKNVHICDSVLDTKDAFWHSENVTVENSIIRGEYLGWYSKRLTLINCKIIGTQPLCYCEDLKLIHCTMEDTDLAFEYSDVEAEIEGHVMSIKNPKSGTIQADSVGEIITEDSVMETTAEIVIRSEK